MKPARVAIRTGWLLLVALMGACAARQAPVASGPKLPEDVGQVVWEALRAGNVTPVHERFDATMARALPSAELRSFWTGVSGQLGELRSWTLKEGSEHGGLKRLAYDLVFARGRAQGVLAVHPQQLTIAGLFVTPASSPAPAAASSAPAAPRKAELPVATASVPGVAAEAVRFGQSPWELDGIITRPRRQGTFPAAILVAGSGPLDKDSTVGANKPFRDLAEGLSSKGIVVLRYDKRTYAHRQNLDVRAITVDQEVIADALHALALLRARPEVDQEAVFVIGHSLGALLAPEIAQRAGRIAGLVLLAPPARPVTEAAIQQLRYLNQIPAAELANLERKAAAIREGSAQAEDTFLGAPASYFIDLQKRDGMGVAKKLGKPILLLRGSRDYQVTDEDFRRWQQSLKGQPGVSAAVLTGLNHLFMPGQGKPGPQDYLVAGKVAPAALTRISTFVKTSAASR
jgi:uncharacterized protein